MILRFRGKDGSYRIDALDTDTFASVISKLEKQLPPHSSIGVAASPSGPSEAPNQKWDQPIATLGLKHGDLLFISYEPSSDQQLLQNSTPERASEPPISKSEVKYTVLDRDLSVDGGLIPRQRSKLCSHGTKGMCEYCQPLEPFDDDYHYEHGIKHLSFWAYVKKLKEASPSGISKLLDAPDYSVKANCTGGHMPWPKGICSKCQPAAITLQQQRFRMVDHVEFSSPAIVSDFIDFWRQTNGQRIGFLIGKYERYDAVPLGIKAVISAIWEADQDDENDALLLKELPTQAVLDASSALGLEVVGVIFTDLVDSGKGDGSVLTKRHAHSYFLSSLEVILAARMQNQFPYPTSLASGDQFGSRFVTAVISGNERGEIDVSCYQASIQAQAMVSADLVCASTNPSVVRIKPASDSRYVPDIFFKHVNEYNLTVQENAKPAFPVDYLLVSLTHGFPESISADSANSAGKFPIENRPTIRSQSVHQLVDRLELTTGLDTVPLSDFHVLAYLYSLGVLQPEEYTLVSRLLAAEREGDLSFVADLATQLAHGTGFATLRAIAA